MSEKEPLPGSHELEPRFFSFVCPERRLEEARKLLRDVVGISLSPEVMPTIRLAFDPETNRAVQVEGIQVSGLAQARDIKRIVQTLAEAQIAGYSRPTQIIVANEPAASSPKEKLPYKPKVKFEKDGLVVSYDPSLKASADTLETEASMVTTFLAQQGKELYFGLRLEPYSTILAISQGLRSYLEDEGLSAKQKDQIIQAAKRLEALANPNN